MLNRVSERCAPAPRNDFRTSYNTANYICMYVYYIGAPYKVPMKLWCNREVQHRHKL